ncbi:hypothetical protein GF324_11845 [bacterium]|nr:hypothetical protein [bacterium]
MTVLTWQHLRTEWDRLGRKLRRAAGVYLTFAAVGLLAVGGYAAMLVVRSLVCLADELMRDPE